MAHALARGQLSRAYQTLRRFLTLRPAPVLIGFPVGHTADRDRPDPISEAARQLGQRGRTISAKREATHKALRGGR